MKALTLKLSQLLSLMWTSMQERGKSVQMLNMFYKNAFKKISL